MLTLFRDLPIIEPTKEGFMGQKLSKKKGRNSINSSFYHQEQTNDNLDTVARALEESDLTKKPFIVIK
jgi:hypothetical protein